MEAAREAAVAREAQQAQQAQRAAESAVVEARVEEQVKLLARS